MSWSILKGTRLGNFLYVQWEPINHSEESLTGCIHVCERKVETTSEGLIRRIDVKANVFIVKSQKNPLCIPNVSQHIFGMDFTLLKGFELSKRL